MLSELDLLRQENAKFLAENAEVKAENVKLRQAIEENAVRLAKLEQSDKEKAELMISGKSSRIELLLIHKPTYSYQNLPFVQKYG
jgi:regulator of replication initiation timing